MDQFELRVFLEKLSSGNYTEEEYKTLTDWMENANREDYESLLKQWEEVVLKKESFELSHSDLFQNIEAGLDNIDQQKSNIKPLFAEKLST